MAQDDFYVLASRLLVYRGDLVARNILRVALIYEDDKIHIDALLDKAAEDIQTIFIGINLPTRTDTSPRQFGMSKFDPDKWTPVYYWDKFPRFTRNGRWTLYLRNLVEQIQQESEEANRLNGLPVDDSILFPEINNITNS